MEITLVVVVLFILVISCNVVVKTTKTTDIPRSSLSFTQATTPTVISNTILEYFTGIIHEKSGDVICPVYLISLPKDIDRRTSLYKIVTPNSVSSTHGKDLDKNLLVEKNVIHSTSLTLGEYGCYLSHYNILKQISKDNKYNVSLILEDDAHFDYKKVTEMISYISDNVKEDWDIIALASNYYENHHNGQVIELNENFKLVKVKVLFGTHILLVNNKNAYKYRKLLPITDPYDIAVANILNAFVLVPSLGTLHPQFGGISNTQGIN